MAQHTSGQGWPSKEDAEEAAAKVREYDERLITVVKDGPWWKLHYGEDSGRFSKISEAEVKQDGPGGYWRVHKNGKPGKKGWATQQGAQNSVNEVFVAESVTLSQFEDKTSLLPHIIADKVSGGDRVFADYAARRTLFHYNHDNGISPFRKGCNQSGNKGRDYLYAFITHWYDAWKANDNKPPMGHNYPLQEFKEDYMVAPLAVQLLEAIRKKNWHEANTLFEEAMQARVIARVNDIKTRVMMEDTKKCELCGSTTNVTLVDGTPLCAKCDPESDLDEASDPNNPKAKSGPHGWPAIKEETKTGGNTKTGGSPTSTETSTSTVANPLGNVTVTGGAGDGNTTVHVHLPEKPPTGAKTTVKEGIGDFPINLNPNDAEKQDTKDRLLKQGKYTLLNPCPKCGNGHWSDVPCNKLSAFAEAVEDFKCQKCGNEWPAEGAEKKCPKCGNNKGILELVGD